MNSSPLPTVLTIAGFDPSGGAGLQADCKTIHALGGYALSAVTAITSQNSRGVSAVEAVQTPTLQSQLVSLAEDYQIDVIKIGMLANRQQVELVADFIERLSQNTFRPMVVIDPVLISSSGKRLLAEEAQTTLINKLLPLATLVTPNIPEALTLLTEKQIFPEPNNASTWFQALSALGCEHILLKGGHSPDPKWATDLLFTDLQKFATEGALKRDIEQHIKTFSCPRLQVQHTHGTGCTLSSAIACNLAKGKDLSTSIEQAKAYLSATLASADQQQPNYLKIAETLNQQRRGSLNHFADF